MGRPIRPTYSYAYVPIETVIFDTNNHEANKFFPAVLRIETFKKFIVITKAHVIFRNYNLLLWYHFTCLDPPVVVAMRSLATSNVATCSCDCYGDAVRL